jgi:hypothetical protein
MLWFCQGPVGVPIQTLVIKVQANDFVEQLQNDNFHYPKVLKQKTTSMHMSSGKWAAADPDVKAWA